MTKPSTTMILDRSDFGSELHPHLWQNLCEDLGQTPETREDGEWPEILHVRITLLGDE